MSIIRMSQCGAAAGIFAMFVGMMVSSGSAQTPAPSDKDLDPKVLAYKLPDQIPWKDDPMGAKMAVIGGATSSKPGLYVVLMKWTPHHMSRPHWHPNRPVHHGDLGDVVGGDRTKNLIRTRRFLACRLEASSRILGKQIHYDGAKGFGSGAGDCWGSPVATLQRGNEVK